MPILHVEYVRRRRKYGILFIFDLFCEYINLEYVWVPVIYRVHQAENVIHILVAASQEYVNTYSTCRIAISCKGQSRVKGVQGSGLGLVLTRNPTGAAYAASGAWRA